MIGIPIGLIYANAGEWVIHKYVLHGLGKRRESFWSFHFFDHHRASRRNGMRDKSYESRHLRLDARTKEALGLVALCGIHAPLFPVVPFFTSTVWYSALRYYRVHKRSHLDPEWARENLTWHYDHHMGPNSECNWCVSRPWFDHIMKTRVPYVGTERERRDRLRRTRLSELEMAAAPALTPAAVGA
jgi:sterol desaturase/sphingolipid hydroxylase (fatty acid hydroxylase superfamily)